MSYRHSNKEGGNTLYGTSQLGATHYDGNVFAVDTNGTDFVSLYSFTGYTDGSFPYASLILSGNTLYGTTVQGGNSSRDYVTGGTIFAVNTDVTGFTVLHNFANSNNPDGSNPYGNLVLSGSMLYGTASGGGTNGYGTIFGVNTNGTDFTVLHAFNSLDGSNPFAGLVPSGNTLYGTAGGGTNGDGIVFAINTDGTGFTILHTFGGSDGADPLSGLLLSGNALYGTTAYGGSTNAGTIFAITLVSVPSIDRDSMSVAGGQLQFVVTGLTSNATVYVQASSDLSSAGKWTSVATNVASGTNMTISGLSVTNAPYRFFRVLETLPP